MSLSPPAVSAHPTKMSTALLTPPTTPGHPMLDDKHAFAKALSAPLHAALYTPPATPEPRPSTPDLLEPPTTRTGLPLPSGPSRARPLSENELSYYLPSRADGVNDMYLHHTLSAPSVAFAPARVLHAWAYQLLQQPLLGSHVRFQGYQDVSFEHAVPRTLAEALGQAQDRLVRFVSRSDKEMVDAYLNGPRTLSNERLALLCVAERAPQGHTPPDSPVRADANDEIETEPRPEPRTEYEIMLCATHYLGDGMALHTFMNELYGLLGSDKTVDDFAALIRAQVGEPAPTGIPLPLEDRLPAPRSRLVEAVGAEEYKRSEARLIGGQSFPGPASKRERHTVVPTFAYSEAETKRILAACKAHGVTIAHAAFALCNLAWARHTLDRTAPSLIYSALNLRPNMAPLPADASSSYFHLAVGYFNIVLPTLLPADLTPAELFWHRARATKAQTVAAVKSPFVVARSRETSHVRASRAVKWAKIDDDEAAEKAAAETRRASTPGLGFKGFEVPARPAPVPVVVQHLAPGPSMAPLRAQHGTPAPSPVPSYLGTPATAPSSPLKSKHGAGFVLSAPPKPAAPAAPAVSQKALMGLSMLGNLDGMYKHASFPSIELTSLTTGSRQRPGALLLFAYTFKGKLWLSLGYDQNGFKDGAIEGFWEEMQDIVKEVLLA